jgi:hypothetical protein
MCGKALPFRLTLYLVERLRLEVEFEAKPHGKK